MKNLVEKNTPKKWQWYCPSQPGDEQQGEETWCGVWSNCRDPSSDSEPAPSHFDETAGAAAATESSELQKIHKKHFQAGNARTDPFLTSFEAYERTFENIL